MLSLGAMARDFDLVHAHDARSHTWAAALARQFHLSFRGESDSRWDRPSFHDGSTDEPAAISLFRSMSNENSSKRRFPQTRYPLSTTA